MARTLTGSYTGPVQVQYAGNNPLSVTGTIEVTAFTALALQPGPGTNWTVNNSGRIVGHSPAFGGLVFGSNYTAVASGTLTNRAGGYIYGSTVGVMVYGGDASVTNLAGGRIAAHDSAVRASGGLIVVNAGTLAAQIFGVSGLGGSFTNLTGGLVSSGATGVRLGSIPSTFTNQTGATISAGGTAVSQYYGTAFNAGLIAGNHYAILKRTGALTNASGGQLIGGRYGVRFGSGSIVNQANATIQATALGFAPNYGTAGRAISTTAASTIENSGLIQSVNGSAIEQASGLLSNASTGTITGRTGVRIGSGTLINAGTIGGFGTLGAVRFTTATASNRVVVLPGAVFNGAVQVGGGVLALASSGSQGTISNLGSFTDFTTLEVEAGATWASSGAGTVASGVLLLNAGTLTGPITLAGGNTLDNSGSLIGSGGTAVAFGSAGNNVALWRPGAAITGAVTGGAGVSNLLRFTAGGVGTQYNLQNNFTGFNRVQVDVGAQWTLSGSLASGMTFANYGSLLAYINPGVGGMVTNAAGATITSTQIVMVFDDSGAATVANAGRLAAASNGFSILLNKGGLVSNASSGFITGRGIVMDGTASVANSGTIESTANATSDGVTLRSAGVITNAAGGTITGQRWGINLSGQGGTLHNAGTITGNSGTAAMFGGTGSNLVVLEPGAVFSGKVVGSASASNRLELASGAGTGTLTSLNSNYTGFSRIDVDSGATWRFTNSSIASGMTLNDAGTIAGGVTLDSSSLLSITSSGSVGSGALFSVVGVNGAQTVVNAGRILAGINRLGVYLVDGGSVTNVAGGTITGFPIRFGFGAGTVVNSGLISADGGPSADGILLVAGGTVANAAGGTISGQRFGITLTNGGTVANSGTIGGANGAVYFGPGGTGRLIVNPGAVFSGKAAFNAAADTTLELAGTASGSLSGLGSSFTGFDALQISSGAHWTLTGSNSLVAGQTVSNAGALTLLNTSLNDPGTLQNNGSILLDPSTLTVAGLTGTGSVTIDDGSTLEVGGTVAAGETINLSGANATFVLDTPAAMAGSVINFGDGDLIRLEGVDPNSVSFSSGQLHFGAGSAFALALANGGPVQAVSDGAGGANVSLLCFCAGTRIATPNGEVPVQRLAVGDLVSTLSGRARPISWIGEGRVLATRGRRDAATPVLVRKGALGPNVPNRDLRITKGHALFFDGALIPVEELINHRSILWDDRASELAIYHVELDTHDVLIANGAPAESYRDDGNRWLFRNANSGWGKPPCPPYAPILATGALVDAVWRDLLERAGPRPGVPLTDDPDLHLQVEGRRLGAVARRRGGYVFRLPDAAGAVRIASRSAIPQEFGLGRDARRLGVGLRRITLRHGARRQVLDLNSPSLGVGFHAFEPQQRLRWTDGDAELPETLLRRDGRERYLVLHVGSTTRYLAEGDCRAAYLG